jgi:hypothetical protein
MRTILRIDAVVWKEPASSRPFQPPHPAVGHLFPHRGEGEGTVVLRACHPASLPLEGRDRGWGWFRVSLRDPHPPTPPLKGEGIRFGTIARRGPWA